ncbi:transcriptional regulator family: Fungal Specific TF [Penicillium roqueforti]|uniref:transcriptional regulator family: Fungal Specific TF n=1 Tax=Penicillium roqueforti TaxID=5082 RepID=UPI00190D3B4F|nr:transcriptional regulator family: Fungal Specific TF [Penicillium roqueforti]KAF9242410.1 transcriptional regulator family: Fungal Specific TF [Penicillium roqueforti]KAI1834719.1 transcriptional regulator family: Fungal Specific TF [Penicillium roqueforti]KAI2676562.1 transcriptional regulator family: Fungal Specific TF [Penicillium roqueforti]KAI2681318.1 transcriptional regulator family: Fungal Specific TF [Penicillium roqueforti]KAI2702877.1 transcriptional regulator family: Fungal Spec
MPRSSPVKIACRLCHDRRVKCDRSEGVACSNCRNARRQCELIISRRGRRRKLLPLTTQADLGSDLSEASRNVPYEGLTSSNPPLTTHAQDDGDKPRQEPCFPAQGPSGKTPYVGDSSNLNYLIQQFGNPFVGTTDARPLQDHLHGAMLARLGRPTTQEIEKLHISTIERIKNQGAFDLPSQETSQALLDCYFHFSLAAPILDKSRFLVTLEEGKSSHLLLNAIYLAATINCSDSVIAGAGFVSRYAASLTFYQRAKSLYDAGYETDAIATIQSTFLMGYWWNGLLEHKDPWYWVGISVGMAQALGLHRIKSYNRLEEKERKLWRRLWWMVYAMDINLSMLLDRPPHVQGRLCNVPPLSEADFDQAMDRFFTIKFDEDSGHSQDICLEQISLCSSSLSPEFKSLSPSSSKWAILTHILYQEYRLLLHRSNPRFSLNTGPGTPTFEICAEIYNMLEILMASDLLYAAAASIVAPVLSVLSIYIVNIHRGDTGVRWISHHRAQLCMLILDKLQDRFPVLAAFYPIYESLLRRHSAGGQTQDGARVAEHSATGSSMGNGASQLDNESNPGSINPTAGLFDQVAQDGMGMAFPFSFPFGNLFEDVFLNSPSQPTAYCEDDISYP